VPTENVKASTFWAAFEDAAAASPCLWDELKSCVGQTGQDVHQALRLTQLVRSKGITHLHAHFASVSTSVARLTARLAGVPYSFTAHAKDIFHEDVCPDDLRGKLADAAAVITVSDYNLRHLVETFGEAAGRVRRVYNGLPLDGFPYRSPAKRPPRVISVGRLVEKKGLCDLIDACALLAKRGLDFDCHIIGDGELAGPLREQIQRLGVASHVQMSGPRPQADVIEAVGNAAMLAAPCIVGDDGNRDGLPTVLLEAMALGTPCISTDVTGIPEVVRHEETGLMVAQRNPAELAGAIERLLEDHALRVRLAEQARRLIEAEFDVHANAEKIRRAIDTASNGHGEIMDESLRNEVD
jgi:colanic acid/amylovoran biosynthesis glycosyltransferase